MYAWIKSRPLLSYRGINSAISPFDLLSEGSFITLLPLQVKYINYAGRDSGVVTARAVVSLKTMEETKEKATGT